MFYPTIRKRGHEAGTRYDRDIPQPNMGSPGIGDFTRAFLGDAGVTGLLDIVPTFL